MESSNWKKTCIHGTFQVRKSTEHFAFSQKYFKGYKRKIWAVVDVQVLKKKWGKKLDKNARYWDTGRNPSFETTGDIFFSALSFLFHSFTLSSEASSALTMWVKDEAKKKGMRTYTLPETNIFAPENGWFEYDRFLLGNPFFRGELLVSGRVTLTWKHEVLLQGINKHKKKHFNDTMSPPLLLYELSLPPSNTTSRLKKTFLQIKLVHSKQEQKFLDSKIVPFSLFLNFFLKCWIFNKKQYLNLRIFKITKPLSFKLPSMFLTNCFDIPLALRILLHLRPSVHRHGANGMWDLVVFKPCLRQNQTLHMTSKSHLTVVLSLCECWSVGQKGVFGHLLSLWFFLGGKGALKIKDWARDVAKRQEHGKLRRGLFHVLQNGSGWANKNRCI